jgi:hypothetical protein
VTDQNDFTQVHCLYFHTLLSVSRAKNCASTEGYGQMSYPMRIPNYQAAYSDYSPAVGMNFNWPCRSFNLLIFWNRVRLGRAGAHR